MFYKLTIAAMMFLLSATVSSAQTLTEALVPVRVNVTANVSIQPPSGVNGEGASKTVTPSLAGLYDTLNIMIDAGNSSITHGARARNAAPVAARYSRGNVSVELSPHHYQNATLSMHSINGRRVFSDKISALNHNTLNLSRPNVAPGVYILSIKGVDGNSYSTRLAHSGGRMNINTTFGGGGDHSLRKDAAATSVGTWTLTATAAGHTPYSQTFTPVPGVNPPQNITLVYESPLVGSSDRGDGTYRNPVIWADVPDMSFIRVGNVYWMASTTMHMNPGVPIMKSYDLVNWETVGYVYNVLDDVNNMKLQTGGSMYAGGTWASSLVYKEDTETFILVVPSPTTNNTYIFHTKDPENEPWAKYTITRRFHDCSLLLDDDGRNWLFYGGGSMIQLNSAVTGLASGATSQNVIPNLHAPDPVDGYLTPAGRGLAEGLQVQKIGDMYYAFAICSQDRRWFRHQVVHRSRSLNGPWEGRVVAYDQGVAQGTIIYTGSGNKHTDRNNWHAMIFRDSGPVGRAPWLMPVTWVDGWPMHGENGSHAPLPRSAPIPINVNTGLKSVFYSDEFNNNNPTPVYYGTSVSTQTNMYDHNGSNLHLAWQWNHNPDNRYWSLTERSGWLRLTTGYISTNILNAPNTLTQRTFGPQSGAVVLMDVTNMKDGDEAGLALFTAKYGSIGVKMENGNKFIVTTLANSWGAEGDGHTTNKGTESARADLTRNRIYLKVEANFDNNRGNFYYSSNGNTWTKLGGELQMTYSTNNHFMGYRFALYNFATATTGGYVDFDYYRVSDRLTGTQ